MARMPLKPFVFITFLLLIGISIQSAASEAPAKADPQDSNYLSPSSYPLLAEKSGLVMLDYETIPVSNGEPIDLMGFHYLNKFYDWMYIGMGWSGPLVRGDYGGFMDLDATLHAQKNIIGNFFVDAGSSVGGGGGGKSITQSKELTGTGGFFKIYAGLGYDFKKFSAGINYSRFTFLHSEINHSQLDFYVQVPVSYSIGPYENSGDRLLPPEPTKLSGLPNEPGENVLSFGLDNMLQLKPTGQNHSTINLFDMQFSHFLTNNEYAYCDIGVGYHGLPFYNQTFGGLGYRVNFSPRINLYGQLGLGSGGYAPKTIDTGPGLLVYPKLSAEYLFNDNIGLALSGGYLFAPMGSSKNITLGASLNYHLFSNNDNSHIDDATRDILFRGFRMNMFQQTEINVNSLGKNQNDVKLFSVQLDNVVNDYFYIPIQLSAAYNDFLGYPGYGELLAGIGLQSKYSPNSRFQTFAQILSGTNVFGVIVKLELGINYSLSDHLALYAQVGHTATVDSGGLSDQYKFSANSIGLGISYRFSVPSR